MFVFLGAFGLLFPTGNGLYAQTLRGFNYQAVARDGLGNLLENQNINVEIDIIQGNQAGTVIYEETHNLSTNNFGLFTLVIGKGATTTGIFDAIDWSANDYFLGVTLDGTFMGASELEGVPFSKIATDMALDHLKDVSAASPVNNQVLKFNGSDWVPLNDENTTYSAGAGLSLAGTTFSATDISPTNEIQTLSLTGSTLSLSNGGGNVNLPAGTPSQWTTAGANIHYNGGKVGIGDATPVATLTVGNGDKFQVDGTEGDLTFKDDGASIQFPNATSSNSPMIYMFESGSSNATRMVISHSPSFPTWGLEYKDTTDIFYLRTNASRRFAFRLSPGYMGIGIEDPAFPIDMQGRIRIRWTGSINNSPGIWFSNQTNTFDRAFLGMSKPDSTVGIYSQHLGKWAVEFELMREPRIGVNIKPGSPPRSEIHIMHTNFGGSNDGLRIQNEGPNSHYWNLYSSNSTGALEFYKQGL
ncbi:MAG: hypothetical protein KDE26_27345, partial [Bacteroidetes bacterium]|nr:hypothetical protein [Bacteroidota bacterium]